MPQQDSGDDGPSLELPSFGIGRTRKRREPEEPADRPDEPVEPTPAPEQPADTTAEPVEAHQADEPAPAARTARRQVSMPRIRGPAAAVVTGLAVGALLVGLAWGSLRLCEVVRGTSSCGQPGFLVLLAIGVLLVLVGRVLLSGFGVDDPGSTSFLGVGVVAVITLLFLTDVLFDWWIVLVIPAVSVASFALSYWVSTAFVETPEGNLHR